MSKEAVNKSVFLIWRVPWKCLTPVYKEFLCDKYYLLPSRGQLANFLCDYQPRSHEAGLIHLKGWRVSFYLLNKGFDVRKIARVDDPSHKIRKRHIFQGDWASSPCFCVFLLSKVITFYLLYHLHFQIYLSHKNFSCRRLYLQGF